MVELAPFPFTLTPMANVTPLTYRDGATYLAVLEGMKAWLNETLLPFVNNQGADVTAQYQAGIDNAEATVVAAQVEWGELFDTFMTNVDAEIQALNDGAVATMVANPATATGAAVALLIQNGVLTGPQIAALIDGTFHTQTAANALFETQAHATATYATLTGVDVDVAAALDLVADTYAPVTDAAAYAGPGDTAATGNKPVKLGVILDKGTGTDFDNHLVESLTVIKDPESGRLAGVYTGYNNTAGTLKGSIGLAYSDDGITWSKQGQLFTASNTAGSGDQNGVTGPVLIHHDGLYHLFYIGLTATGYEGGDRSLMLATSPSLTDPVWTRQGVMLDAGPGGNGWHSEDVWHPSIVRDKDTWYLFVNASGVVGAVNAERIGYATATALTGPWTYSTNHVLAAPGSGITGDPSVTKTPGGWRMDYFSTTVDGASDYYTTTTDVLFPEGWLAHDTQRRTIEPGPAGTFDELYAHKPFILHYAGRTFHYYTAVMAANTNRRIGVAVDGGNLPARGPTKETGTTINAGTFVQLRSGALDANVTAGVDWGIALNGAAIIQARPGDLVEFTIGYGADNGAGDLRADVVALNNGVPSTYISGTTNGITGWGAIGGRFEKGSGTYHYIVKTVDVYKGTVTFAPVFRSAGVRIIQNTTTDPIEFSVRNIS